MNANTTVGLFGTCGNSKWRDPFIEALQARNINYFNPLKTDWKPEDALDEARHAKTDDIIVLPVTGESLGTASLAEIGFLIAALIVAPHRKGIVFIEPEVDQSLVELNPQAAKESNNARKIVRAHLSLINLPNLFVVKDLNEALTTTLDAGNSGL